MFRIYNGYTVGVTQQPIHISATSPCGYFGTAFLTCFCDIGGRTNEDVTGEMDGTRRAMETKCVVLPKKRFVGIGTVGNAVDFHCSIGFVRTS